MLAGVVSSFLFGINHFYSTAYIIYAIIIGLGFSLVYIFARKVSVFYSIIVVMSIHSIINGISFLLNYVFEVEI